jgi:hypothetical protein
MRRGDILDGEDINSEKDEAANRPIGFPAFENLTWSVGGFVVVAVKSLSDARIGFLPV